MIQHCLQLLSLLGFPLSKVGIVKKISDRSYYLRCALQYRIISCCGVVAQDEHNACIQTKKNLYKQNNDSDNIIDSDLNYYVENYTNGDVEKSAGTMRSIHANQPRSNKHKNHKKQKKQKFSIILRLRQIALLLFALIVGFVGFFYMCERTYGKVAYRWAPLLVIMGLLFIILWSLILAFHSYASQTILACVALLTFIGITVIMRVDKPNETSIGYKQLIWTCVALALSCIFVALLRNYKILRRFSYISMVIGLVLLLSPMLPVVGRSSGGARIWIAIGQYSMQPSEFAKLFLAFFFAAYFFDRRDQLSVAGKKILGVHLPRWSDLGPIIIVWAIAMGVLVLQHDLGTSLMFFAMFISMIYMATGRFSWVILGILAFIIGAFLAMHVFAHVGYRVDAWIHPFDEATYNRYPGGSSQLVSGLFGIASGGLFGTGFGVGHPELTPLSYSDFVYSALGEEIGLTGLLAILMLYVIIIASGFITALRIKDGFGKLLSAGLVFTMAFQVFTVVGGITRVIPLTGLTLPYIAAGGSSLVANYILAMILIVLSGAANAPQNSSLMLQDTLQHEVLATLRKKTLEQQKSEQEQTQKAALQIISQDSANNAKQYTQNVYDNADVHYSSGNLQKLSDKSVKTGENSSSSPNDSYETVVLRAQSFSAHVVDSQENNQADVQLDSNSNDNSNSVCQSSDHNVVENIHNNAVDGNNLASNVGNQDYLQTQSISVHSMGTEFSEDNRVENAGANNHRMKNDGFVNEFQQMTDKETLQDENLTANFTGLHDYKLENGTEREVKYE